MSDVATPLGSPIPYTFGEETILLDGLKVGDVGVIQNHLKLERKRQLKDALAELKEFSDLPAPLVEAMHADAIARYRGTQEITVQAALDWATSPEGFPLALMLSLGRRYPNRYPLDEVRRLVGALSANEYKALSEAFAIASGWMDESKKKVESDPAKSGSKATANSGDTSSQS